MVLSLTLLPRWQLRRKIKKLEEKKKEPKSRNTMCCVKVTCYRCTSRLFCTACAQVTMTAMVIQTSSQRYVEKKRTFGRGWRPSPSFSSAASALSSAFDMELVLYVGGIAACQACGLSDTAGHGYLSVAFFFPSTSFRLIFK